MDDARDERRRRRISRAETRRVVNGARERANAPQHGQHFMIRSVIELPFQLREMWSIWTGSNRLAIFFGSHLPLEFHRLSKVLNRI